MKTNKLLSVVLTLCVLLAAFSLTALAAEGETYPIAVAYCVEGDENGVVEEYAAENLQNAINEIAKTAAMFEATAVKMTLQADVTGVASTLTVPAGTEFTLDLAGHTLEGNNQGKDQAFLLVNGKLTLTDSVGTGKVCSTYTGTAGRVVSVVGGELTVAGGTITTEGMAKAGNAIYVSKGSTLSMTGGKVYADAKRGNYAIRIGGKDAIFTMTGGVAEADSSTTETYITAIDVSSTGTVTIGGDSVVRGPKALTTTSLTALTVTGGSFTGEVSAPKNSISGGTFTTDVTDYLADEHVKICKKQTDGTYQVLTAAYAAAKIIAADGVVTRYAAATEAFSALKDGDTLVMLDDIGTAAEPLPYGIVVTDGDVNVNLNAKTLIIGYDAAAAAAAGVPGYAAGVGIVNGGSGTVTVSGNGTLDVSNYTGTDGIAVWARTGNITVQSGTFINKSNEEATVYVGTNDDSSPVLKIAGGTYKNIAEGNYKYDESRTPLTFNIYNGKTADALKISAGKFYGNNDPYLGDDQVKGRILTTEMTGVRKNDGYYVVAANQGIQLLDANGGAKNFYSGASTSSTGKITVALADAADGDTLILLKDISTSNQLNVTKAITIDLGGHTLTNSYAPSNGGYTLLTRAAVTMKNGTYKSTKDSARGIGAVADFTLENATLRAAGLVGLGCSAADATYTVKNSTVIGNYAIANFVNNATINIENSTITGSGVGIYHNGSNSGLQLTATGSTITAAATGETNGIYVSGSTDTMAAAGAQQVTLTNCTVSGGTAVEVKYTDLTLTDCTVTATAETPSYTQDDNGAATTGFAVVSTDNTTGAATPAPKGKITIQGANGSYKGQVGLASLETVKTNYADFADTTYAISGGSFTKEVLPEYCAAGFVPVANEDGTYGVTEKPAGVAKIGDKYYDTLADAIAAAKDGETVTLTADTTEDVTITGNITLDLGTKTLTNTGAGKATLTVSKGATATVKNGSIVGGASYYNIAVGTEVNSTANLTLENVTATAGNTGSSMLDNWGTLTITSGTYTGGLNVVKSEEGSTLNISGGKFELNYAESNKYNGVILSAGTTTISGGEFTQNATTPRWGNPQVVLAMQVDGYTSKIEITSGIFTNNKSGGSIFHGSGKATSDNFEVSGGTFNKSISDGYCADGFIPTKNADGTYGVKEGKYVAKIGSTKYETLDDAVRLAAKGKTIKLLDDLDISATGLTVAATKTVTLDLNGHALKAANTNTGNIKVLGKLTLCDSTDTAKNGTGTGKVWTDTPYIFGEQDKVLIAAMDGGTFTMESGLIDTASSIADNANYGQFAVSVQNENADATVIINGGHIKAGWYAVAGNGTDITYNGNITVNGGILESVADYAIYHPHTGTTTVNGGVIFGAAGGISLNRGKLIVNDGTITSKGTGTTGNWGDGTGNQQAAAINVNAKYETTAVEIKGGKITAEKDAILLTNGRNGTVAVSGGSFSSEIKPEYCAAGFVPAANADGTYGVKAAPVAKIGTVEYATLAEAIAAAKDGDTVTLTADINTPETSYYIQKSLTIDLGGKTLTGSGYDGVFNIEGENAAVRIKNGKIVAVEQTGTAGKYTMAVWACAAGCEVTLEDLDVSQQITHTDDKQMDMIYTSKGTIIINSGRFESGTPAWTLNCNDSAYKAGTAKIIVNGGTFVGYDPRNNTAEGKGTSFVAEGVGVDAADGSFTAVPNMAAQIVDADGNSVAAYTGHYDAIAAAKDGEKVILLSDRKNFVTNTINANITIDLNGKTLSVGNNNPFFRTNGEVTIQNGTITSNMACVIVNAYNKLTLKNVKITGVTGNNGKNLVNVCSNAEVTIDKDTVLTASGSNGAAVFIGQDADAKYTLNVYGKVIQESKSFAISGNGSYKGTTTINIYDGAEVKSASVAIYHPQAGVINVNGGLVEGYCAIGIKSGTLNINGGTVRGTADDHVLDDSNSTSGTIIYDGSAIIVDSRSTGYAGNVNINVTGGTVESYYSTAIREIGEQDKPNMTQLTKLNITGGSVLGANQQLGNVTNDMLVRDISSSNVSVSGGTFNHAVPETYCADGFIPTKNADGTYGVKKILYVAEVNGVKFATLADAIAAATRNSTVTLLADTKENVTISTPYVTLDLNGHTLNGSTGERKPALTITARVTVKDSSAAKTGTIMREDTAENSGVSSHYVIDVQGSGWLTFESGNVKNDSGAGGTNGASLVRVGDDRVAKYPGLNIKGGTFTQDNFIVIKVERGDLFLNGGSLNSANSYAVQTWHRATIKGGTVNGAVSSWTYDGGPGAETTISGGTVNGNVEAISYDGKAGKPALVSISGGTVNGALIAGIYNSATEPTKDMATIGITGGTFANDPTKYVVEGATVTKNSEGKFGVEKAYLARVGETEYYTMDEAFKAQTASGEPVVLLRDYTTGGTFKSGSINRTVDLNGYTWTYTGTDVNDAAFEINYPDVTLTVKNGTVVSSTMVGLIPSAMGGTIKYDNSGLVLDGVTATANGNSGIETNGNNTNDTVTLKNSTLNVPNGFGIYFPSSGTLTLDNSTVNAKTMGVQVCAGSLSINEGSAVTVTGDAVPKAENDGAIQDGAAISVVNRTGYKGLGTVTVSGGKFTAKEGNSAIKAYDWANKIESDFTADKGTVAVSGGTFSSAVPAGLCAEGYAPKQNADGTYGVAEKAKVGLSDNMLVIPCGSEGEYHTLAFLFGIDSLNYDELGLNITICDNGTSRPQQLRVHTVYTKVKDGAGQTWEPAAVDAATSESHYLFAETMNVPKARVDEFSADAYVLVQPYVKDLDGNMLVKNSYKIPISYFVNQSK